MHKQDNIADFGYKFIVPIALVVSLVGVLVSISNEANLVREIECEKDPRTVWDTKQEACLPRAKTKVLPKGPTPQLDAPNPLSYGKPLNLREAPHGTP